MSTPVMTEPATAVPLSLAPLRHPSEYSRMLLALSASAIAIGGYLAVVLVLGGATALAVFSAVILTLLVSIWTALQLYRSRLLGQSVRITRDSLPTVQVLVDEIRAQLDYHRPVDIYVSQKAVPSMSLTSYFGTKVILIEGALIGDLIGANRQQLTFLLARTFGALKARHERLAVAVVVLDGLRLLPFVAQFLLPYYRATTYSGDQIGLACCGSLETALTATERLLVGREVEPSLRRPGVIAQAQSVRSRLLPRLLQFLGMAEPHLTNRYINLLLFCSHHDPAASSSFHAEFDDQTKHRLAALARTSAHRRPVTSRGRRAVLAAIAAAVTIALVGATTALALSARDSLTSDATDSTDVTFEPPPPLEPPPPIAPPAALDLDAADTANLLSHIPAQVSDSCTDPAPDFTPPQDAVASLSCELGDAAIYYSSFDSPSATNAAFKSTVSAVGEAASGGSCKSGGYRGIWTTGETKGGELLCWSSDGTAWIEWGSDDLDIEAYMLRNDGDSAKLYRQWLKAGPE